MARKTNWNDVGATIGFVMIGILAVIFITAIVAGVLLLPCWLLMLAWNGFASGVLGLPAMSLWQALALAVLLSAVRSIFSLTINFNKKGNKNDLVG